MAKRNNLRLVGVFILGAIALLVAAVVVLGGGLLFKQQTRVVAYFQGSVSGLSVGAPVNIRGCGSAACRTSCWRSTPVRPR